MLREKKKKKKMLSNFGYRPASAQETTLPRNYGEADMLDQPQPLSQERTPTRPPECGCLL